MCEEEHLLVERDFLDGVVLNSGQALEYELVNEVKADLFERGAKVVDIGG